MILLMIPKKGSYYDVFSIADEFQLYVEYSQMWQGQVVNLSDVNRLISSHSFRFCFFLFFFYSFALALALWLFLTWLRSSPSKFNSEE